MVASAGASVEAFRGFTAGIRWRYVGARPLTADGVIHSRPSSTLSARASCAIGRRAQLEIDVFNVLGARVADIDYFYISRLPGEPREGVADRHTHPMPPRTARIGLRMGL
jgi:hypothetical protein